MGQHCCCIGGTVEAEREEAPRASRRESRRVAALLARAAGDEESRRGGVAAEEGAERAALTLELKRGGERARQAGELRLLRGCRAEEEASRAAEEAAEGLTALELREDWGRRDISSAWGQLRGELMHACSRRCAAAASESRRGRSSSSGRSSDGATPESGSAAECAQGAAGEAAASGYEHYVTLGQRVGQGTFGIVFAAEVKNPGDGCPGMPSSVAVKVFAAPEGDKERAREALAAISSVAQHPNLVSTYLHGALSEDQGKDFFIAHSGATGPPIEGKLVHYWVIMSQARQSLQDYIRWRTSAHDERIHVKLLASWVQQAARGLGELHRHGLVHTDYKVSNLLLARRESSTVVQVGDLDSVHAEGCVCWTFTPKYLDPLVWASRSPTTSLDWDRWSLGITAHWVLTQGSLPSGLVEAFEAAERGEYSTIHAHQALPAVMRAPLELCWLPAGERCTAEDFAAACNPRKFNKSLPEGSSAYEDFKAVMYETDQSFDEWLERHKAKSRVSRKT